MSSQEKKINKPIVKPRNPCFSSGPCAKRPGWLRRELDASSAGRSHRSNLGVAKLQETLAGIRKILEIPSEYLVAIVPGSDTGAFEMLMWNFLGKIPAQILYWENFGSEWMVDVTTQLKLADVTSLKADYGKLPDLEAVDFDQDVVFTWNGTTSGVALPNGDWIADNRKGLSLCDAVSAVGITKLPWHKLDATSFSWQKAFGSEAAHGVIVLSPRAIMRVKSYQPTWPLPKIFRFTKDGNIIENLFLGYTINTPSMLCIEDMLDALKWAESVGGLDGLIARCRTNNKLIMDWVSQREWVDFLCEDKANLSASPVCLKIIDPVYMELTPLAQKNFVKDMAQLLELEKAGYDLKGHMAAPPNIRIWCGPTVEVTDIEILLQWLDYAFQVEKYK